MKGQNLVFAGMIAVGVILYISCRKTETIVEHSHSVLSSKFFNSHSATDPLVTEIVELLKRENDKHNLVHKISSRIGFPYCVSSSNKCNFFL